MEQGKRFGYLTTIEFMEKSITGHTDVWKCLCDCGEIKPIRINNLLSGNSTSCGCGHGLKISYPITNHQLRYLVRYDPDGGLFTRVARGRKSKPGSILGTLDRSNGYVRITVDCKKYWAHRLAWFYMTGQWPLEQIDHRDTDRSNNRWANLRLSSQTQNNGNSSLSSANSTGKKGVTFDVKSGLYVAQIGYKGINHYLGRYNDLDVAASAYDAAANLYFGEFARHNSGAGQ